jgi:hypothetical protein
MCKSCTKPWFLGCLILGGESNGPGGDRTFSIRGLAYLEMGVLVAL